MARDMQSEKSAKAANGAAAPAEANTIEQVRELLFGTTKRTIEQHLDDLEKKVDARIADLRSDLLDRLAALEARLIDAERGAETKRLAAFKDIGAAITELGASINNLGSTRAGR
jgi:tRNA U34 5-carboxymethylaminomethyl modifying GTPase MnmE/TrmE